MWRMNLSRLLSWFAAVLIVSLVSMILSERGSLDPIQNQYLRLTSPLTSRFSDLALDISDFFEGAADHGDLVRENDRLLREIERLQAQLAVQQDAQQRLQELENLLNVREGRPQDTFATAGVISYDSSNINRVIAIDRGTRDGVKDGMVVLSENASLVGSVTQALDDFSWVALITDPDSVVNVKVLLAATEARGVMSGDLGRGLLLDLVSPETRLEQNALVVTSGLGGNYPAGLLVGSIRSIENQPQAIFQRAGVEGSAPLSRLTTVLVLTSFTPARLQGP